MYDLTGVRSYPLRTTSSLAENKGVYMGIKKNTRMGVVGSMLTYPLVMSNGDVVCVLGTTPILYSESVSWDSPIYVEYDRYPDVRQPSFNDRSTFEEFTLTRNSDLLLHFNTFATSAETWTYGSQREKRSW